MKNERALTHGVVKSTPSPSGFVKRRNKDPFSACQRFWSLLSLWYRNAVNVREKQGDEGPVQSRSPRKEKRNG